MVPGAGLEPARCFHRGILSPLRLPNSAIRALHMSTGQWRLSPESNRGTRLCRPLHDHSATQPIIRTHHRGARPAHITNYNQKIRMERETRFELATPTLARLCSTTELFPLACQPVYSVTRCWRILSDHPRVSSTAPHLPAAQIWTRRTQIFIH